MKFSSFSIYSIIILIETAKKNTELFHIREFSVEQDIPVNSIRKIVHFLSLNGYLITIRGNGGGFKLRKNISEINIGRLLRLTETMTKSNKHNVSNKKLKEACNNSDIIAEAIAAMFAVFEKYTLADLLKNNSPLSLIAAEVDFPDSKISYG